jgi:hypothetical protein
VIEVGNKMARLIKTIVPITGTSIPSSPNPILSLLLSEVGIKYMRVCPNIKDAFIKLKDNYDILL